MSMKQNLKHPLFLIKIACLLFLFIAGIFLFVHPAALLLLIPLGLLWFFPVPKIMPHLITAAIATTAFIIITQLMAGYSLAIFQTLLYIIPNYAVYLLPMYLCSLFYKKNKIPFYTIFILGMAIALVQFYTTLFRGFPATIADISSIKTAISVMTNYSYSISPRMWIGFVCFLLTVQLFSHTKEIQKKKKPSFFLPAILAIVFLFGYFIFFDMNIMPGAKLSAKGTYLGSVVTFFDDIKHIFVEKPPVTQTEESLALLSEKTPVPPATQPDIVVVMNESLFDLAALNALPIDEDPLPFYHNASTLPNAETGHTLVPAYGGNTCNSEYEFLTNFSMLFRPQGSSPYMTPLPHGRHF